MRGVGAGLPDLGWERRAVPDLARVDAAVGEVAAGCVDVGDDRPALGRAGRGRRQPSAERDRGGRARGRELDDAKAVQRGHVVVEPPAQPLVKLLGPVDAGHRDDLHLQMHVDRPGGRVAAGAITACFGGAHACLLERFLQVVARARSGRARRARKTRHG